MQHSYRIIIRSILTVLTLAVMVMIFMFSSQDGEASHETSAVITEAVVHLLHTDYDALPAENREAIFNDTEFVIRKLGHFSEYALLGFLLCATLLSYDLHRWRLVGWVGASLYAVTDEIHQSFSDGRTPLATDVLIDSSGAVFGLLILILVLQIYHAVKRKHT